MLILVLLVENTRSSGKAVIKGLLVLVYLLLRDGLTVLSMWSGSMADDVYEAGDWTSIVNIVSAYATQMGLSAKEKR